MAAIESVLVSKARRTRLGTEDVASWGKARKFNEFVLFRIGRASGWGDVQTAQGFDHRLLAPTENLATY